MGDIDVCGNLFHSPPRRSIISQIPPSLLLIIQFLVVILLLTLKLQVMKLIKYKEWQVECCNDEPVTIDNYYKHDIVVTKVNGEYVTTIRKTELSLPIAQDLLSGDEVLAQQALNCIISNMEFELDCLRRFNKDKLNYKMFE